MKTTTTTIARVLLRLPDGAVAEKDLEAGVAEEMAALQARGAALSHPRSPAAKFVKLGVRMLVLRRIVTRTEAGLLVNPDERVLLAYYANSIAHLFEG